MIIRVVTLGCKVNQCESASIVAALKTFNYNASEGLEPADVYILNTCSVTSEADKKSRQYLTKMRKLNRNCNIIVIGCSAQNNYEKFKQENVVAIGGTLNKVNFAVKAVKNLCENDDYNTISDIILYDNLLKSVEKQCEYCYEPYPKFDKTRAFIKIQDGCNRFCTYCIIPYLRGRSRSRSIDDIMIECDAISSKEIVLTGIDMSYYGRDIGVTFGELLRALGKYEARKRLGSLECEIIDDAMLKAMRQGNYCPHFHLSLQSGCDEVLRSMNRRYSCDFYLDKVNLIRKYFVSASITTDIIVGFPTETDKNFEETCDFVEKCGFSDIHVFPYSSRTGTLASKKYRPLHADVVKNRVSRLLELKANLRGKFLNDNIGTTASVYVEDRDGDYNVGYTPNYIKVYSTHPCGSIADLRLSELFKDGVIGE